jgi:two-component system chemotaxis response regulator CheY
MAKTILAVDDSSSIRQLLNSTLSEFGFRVIEAVDGRDGLEKLANSEADLIITDLHMPNLDGIDLITGVRSLPAFRFVPIIMLTTEHQRALKQAGAAAGATAWLTKPFRPEELMKVIRKVMQ